MRYRFTGRTPEDFPAPPIARRLEPGDEVETDEEVSHARLELLDAPSREDDPAEEPAVAAVPARSRSRAAKATEEA